MQKYLKIQIKLAVQKLVLSFSQKVFFTMYLQDYSTKVQHKAQYFFLFERASKAAGTLELPFLNLPSILVQKRTNI